MLNYFNYFTEIEERFSQRKGGIHMLSTLDWALAEVWKDAGLPLEAVLRGIDSAFDHWDKRPDRHKVRKVNSLAFCAQEVLACAQEMASAAVGASTPARPERETGFEAERVRQYLHKNADALAGSKVPSPSQPVIDSAVLSLRELAAQLGTALSNEEAERHLTVLEEKIYAAVLAATPDAQLVDIRLEAEREMSPYKRKMQPAQISQLQQQYVHKRLIEKCNIPRLSLFYLY